MDQVDIVVSQLKLQKCENTPIALISGGEKKRLNIGSEVEINSFHIFFVYMLIISASY